MYVRLLKVIINDHPAHGCCDDLYRELPEDMAPFIWLLQLDEYRISCAIVHKIYKRKHTLKESSVVVFAAKGDGY